MNKHPIRLKGYWRALRAKKRWAVEMDKLGYLSFPWTVRWCYLNVDFKDLVYTGNPFLKLLPKY